jgi:penicillin-binding protein 1C
LLSVSNEDDQWRLRTELEEVSPELIKQYCKEDSWFYWHFGVNPVSIVTALYKNAISGEVESELQQLQCRLQNVSRKKERITIN